MNILNLIKKYATSAFSGYTSIILAAFSGILITYITTLNLNISNQKTEIEELNKKIGSFSEKLINEKETVNNKIISEVLEKNNNILKKENESLKKQNEQLKELNKQKELSKEEINNELSKLKNKKCLNSVIDEEVAASLIKIFNGE